MSIFKILKVLMNMHHFAISFVCLGNTHSARVHKTMHHSIEFIVYDVHPFLFKLPRRLVFISNPATDQLIYKSFDAKQSEIIQSIGEAIFNTCSLQKIKMHC